MMLSANNISVSTTDRILKFGRKVKIYGLARYSYYITGLSMEMIKKPWAIKLIPQMIIAVKMIFFKLFEFI